MRTLATGIFAIGLALSFAGSRAQQLLPPTPEVPGAQPTQNFGPPASLSTKVPLRPPESGNANVQRAQRINPLPPNTNNPRLLRPVPQPARPPELTALQFDATVKEHTAKAGETTAQFVFALTNISKEEVTVNWVRPSCGCTVAKLPPVPWKLAAGEGGQMEFALDLKGKHGLLSKYVQVDTSHGQKLLNIKATIPQGAEVAGMDQRTRNMQLALADRQVVFRGDCAKCHSEPAVGKLGEPLFAAACGICHEAPHRATMVPDLANVKNPGTKDYWKLWVTTGKPGSLMPAFAQAHGGPLTQDQIDSLAEFLVKKYPAKEVVSTSAAGGQ